MSLNPDTTDQHATRQSETVANHPSMKREKSRPVSSVFTDINNRSLGFEERLSARITQAQGVLNALAAAYDEDKDAFRPAPSVMRDALWAVSALLKQADKAQRRLSDEIVALKRLVDPDLEKE
jgi:hypothetical protein